MSTFAPPVDIRDRVRYDQDGNKHCWCNSCLDFLPEDNFGKNKNSTNGRDYRCRKCRVRINKIVESQEDFIIRQSKIILSNLGYDVDKDISTQFMEKHKYKMRK